MRILGIISALIFGFSSAAWAQEGEDAFYAAFKKFCTETGAEPDSVKAAVEATPLATPIRPPASTAPPYPMTAVGWNVNWNGHPLIINSGTSLAPYGPGLAMPTVSCVVSSRGNEDAGIAAIRKWVGVQSDPQASTSSGSSYYTYREDGFGRKPMIGDDAALKSAMAQGKAWLLTVVQWPDFASAQLMHFLAPTAAKPN